MMLFDNPSFIFITMHIKKLLSPPRRGQKNFTMKGEYDAVIIYFGFAWQFNFRRTLLTPELITIPTNLWF